jgi:three-Cys-motif partner protein
VGGGGGRRLLRNSGESPERPEFDVIGYWSEIKLDIVREYAQAYSQILSAQGFHHVYVDGFAGAGVHISKGSGDFVLGSPLNALKVQPPFREYFLIDLDGDKIESLKKLVATRSDVRVFHGDCNEVLMRDVFPHIRWKNYRRGLCLLDPYGLQLQWRVIAEAGGMKTVDLFLNFPIMDINRNVLWRNPDRVSIEQAKRLTAFWGDVSWRTAAYRTEPGLFGDIDEKTDNAAVAEAFRKRLKDVAGFQWVPAPMPMRNRHGAVVYYLFFASQKAVAQKIVLALFDRHAEQGS